MEGNRRDRADEPRLCWRQLGSAALLIPSLNSLWNERYGSSAYCLLLFTKVRSTMRTIRKTIISQWTCDVFVPGNFEIPTILFIIGEIQHVALTPWAGAWKCLFIHALACQQLDSRSDNSQASKLPCFLQVQLYHIPVQSPERKYNPWPEWRNHGEPTNHLCHLTEAAVVGISCICIMSEAEKGPRV